MSLRKLALLALVCAVFGQTELIEYRGFFSKVIHDEGDNYTFRQSSEPLHYLDSNNSLVDIPINAPNRQELIDLAYSQAEGREDNIFFGASIGKIHGSGGVWYEDDGVSYLGQVEPWYFDEDFDQHSVYRSYFQIASAPEMWSDEYEVSGLDLSISSNPPWEFGNMRAIYKPCVDLYWQEGVDDIEDVYNSLAGGTQLGNFDQGTAEFSFGSNHAMTLRYVALLDDLWDNVFYISVKKVTENYGSWPVLPEQYYNQIGSITFDLHTILADPCYLSLENESIPTGGNAGGYLRFKRAYESNWSNQVYSGSAPVVIQQDRLYDIKTTKGQIGDNNSYYHNWAGFDNGSLILHNIEYSNGAASETARFDEKEEVTFITPVETGNVDVQDYYGFIDNGNSDDEDHDEGSWYPIESGSYMFFQSEFTHYSYVRAENGFSRDGNWWDFAVWTGTGGIVIGSPAEEETALLLGMTTNPTVTANYVFRGDVNADGDIDG